MSDPEVRTLEQLREGIAAYEAMQEGVAVRIADLEAELQRANKRLDDQLAYVESRARRALKIVDVEPPAGTSFGLMMDRVDSRLECVAGWQKTTGCSHPDECRKRLDEAADLEALFQLQYRRTMKATAEYVRAHPPRGTNYMPDLGDLVGWLMYERNRLRHTVQEAISCGECVDCLHMFDHALKPNHEEEASWIKEFLDKPADP